MVWITEYYTAIRVAAPSAVHRRRLPAHPATAPTSSRASPCPWNPPALPVIVISIGILFSYSNAGLFGIAIAATTMLALAGMIVALDAYGPVTDNAGGIAEMSNLPGERPRSHRRA